MISSDISLAVDRLRAGAIVAIPTETVYGLAADAYCKTAIEAVFAAKNRPFFDPLIVHIGRWGQLDEIAEPLSAVENHLLKAFWPGPLTILKNKKEVISDLITSGYDTVAIRMPSHKIALELLNRLENPVVAPSANQFGKTSTTTASDVADEFPEELLILDGGPCEIGIESTIVSCDNDTVTIHRPGGASRERISHVLAKGKFGHSIVAKQNQAAPGQLKHHYQPTKPLLVYRNVSELETMLRESALNLEECFFVELAPEATIAARTLYSNLRLADASEAKSIVMQWSYPTTGDWEGIWDRVKKAGTKIAA